MLTLHTTMDAHSLEIRRDGKRIGHVLWHDSEPLLGLLDDVSPTFRELEEIMAETKQTREQRKN